ncbi:uncharacterized protein IWZ02DRAFT_78804 [Phyllosticta citriasiana]|uniref:uncharacterized protein n=1 Tax=Phyllosticta citriasiana TaxID=595635 RepID=UPI0030FDD76C
MSVADSLNSTPHSLILFSLFSFPFFLFIIISFGFAFACANFVLLPPCSTPRVNCYSSDTKTVTKTATQRSRKRKEGRKNASLYNTAAAAACNALTKPAIQPNQPTRAKNKKATPKERKEKKKKEKSMFPIMSYRPPALSLLSSPLLSSP